MKQFVEGFGSAMGFGLGVLVMAPIFYVAYRAGAFDFIVQMACRA
jgi:hypothetical protein